jgi:hypothetical protein
MAEETLKALDATDATQVLVALQDWINGLSILNSKLYLEYTDNKDGFGYYIKSDGGAILEEDIDGGFSAELPFSIYFKTNDVPDSTGELFKPLNKLAAWFRKNGTSELDIGSRRTPDELTTLRGPTDLAGKDEDGNTTFFSIFSLTYYEEVN